LKPLLLEQDLSIEILYLNLAYAFRFSPEFHEWIAEGSSELAMIGEWIFSPLPLDHTVVEQYKTQVLVPNLGADLTERIFLGLLQLRTQRDSFVMQCVQAIAAKHPRIVGFSSTFQQTNASLLIAAQLKVQYPNIIIVFGGANCEGEMKDALLETYHCIDFVFSGSAEDTFPRFAVEVVQQGRTEFDRRYFIGRGPQQLDDLPYPDFDDYFRQLRELKLDQKVLPGLLMEAARGCFWGMKSHCRFCGLNGLSMQYRRKGAQRLLAEIHYLTRLYNLHRIEFVDNILAPRYANSVFKELGKEPIRYEFFFEMLPHINVDSLKLLRGGGVHWVQAGVESLNDNLVQRMGKSGSVLQRIEFLRHCSELDIRVDWNFLYGVPGESAEDYTQMEKLVPLLLHLTPPSGSVSIRPERFSPYFDQPEAREHLPIKPIRAYEYVFDADPSCREQLAYFFEFDWAGPNRPQILAKGLLNLIEQWRELHSQSHKPTLRFVDTSVVVDSRSSKPRELKLAAELLYILNQCRRIISRQHLRERYELERASDWLDFDKAIDALAADGLIIAENGEVLSLVMDQESSRFTQKVFPGGQLAA
jgi:ribosomal peptide maturation radical SAM protein 1